MPRPAVEDNSRMSLRIPAEEKAILLRAAALRRTDLTDFVRQYSLSADSPQTDHSQLHFRAPLFDKDSAWVSPISAAGFERGVLRADAVKQVLPGFDKGLSTFAL